MTVIAIISMIYWCLDKKLGEYLLVSLASATLVNGFAKVAACIYRPWILDSRITPVKEAIADATGYSFPSGHTTKATTLFGGAVIRGKFSKALNITLIVCLILVAFSRNYVGVHSILDVIFAIISTFIVLLLISKLFDRLEEKPNLDIIISCAGILIAILIIIFTLTKSYPMDYDSAGRLIVDPAIMAIDTFEYAGLAVGVFLTWPIERRFVKFSIEGSVESKVLRYIWGFIGLELMMNVILPLFGESFFEGFLKYALLMAFVVLIYPAIIKFFQNRKK